MRVAALTPAWFRIGRTTRVPASSSPKRVSDVAREQPLLPRVAVTEPGAIEACVDRYSGAIWSMARSSCRTHAEAEDACQDIFLNLWRHADRFDADVGSEWTFVMTIARRRLIDRLRRTSRRIRMTGESEASLSTFGNDYAGPDEAAEIAEDASRAVDAMRHLSEPQRLVLRMSIFDGQSYPEISDKLDLPLGTVKTHARRGLIRLRKELGEPDVETE